VVAVSLTKKLNPTNPMNPVMQATALIHQAAATSDANSVESRRALLNRADVAIAQASNLSGDKVKPDSMTLAVFYEMKGAPERAADELESYLKKTPQAKNSQAIQSEIRRLREKARASKAP